MPDSNITLRSVKGSALSHSEMDANFREFFYSASVSGSEVKLYRSQSANPFELINLSEPKGPQYAIQLKRGTAETGASIDFTGSKSLTYDFSSSVLEVTGSSFFLCCTFSILCLFTNSYIISFLKFLKESYLILLELGYFLLAF